jgi:hypothetical protein
MAPQRPSASALRAGFPAGTVVHDPVTGEYAAQEERFEVLDGVLGPRRGDERGELRAGDSVTALLAEAFGDEIVFARPPRVVQRALALTVAPIARRRGRSVTREVMREAIVAPDRGRPADAGAR